MTVEWMRNCQIGRWGSNWLWEKIHDKTRRLVTIPMFPDEFRIRRWWRPRQLYLSMLLNKNIKEKHITHCHDDGSPLATRGGPSMLGRPGDPGWQWVGSFPRMNRYGTFFLSWWWITLTVWGDQACWAVQVTPGDRKNGASYSRDPATFVTMMDRPRKTRGPSMSGAQVALGDRSEEMIQEIGQVSWWWITLAIGGDQARRVVQVAPGDNLLIQTKNQSTPTATKKEKNILVESLSIRTKETYWNHLVRKYQVDQSSVKASELQPI